SRSRVRPEQAPRIPVNRLAAQSESLATQKHRRRAREVDSLKHLLVSASASPRSVFRKAAGARTNSNLFATQRHLQKPPPPALRIQLQQPVGRYFRACRSMSPVAPSSPTEPARPEDRGACHWPSSLWRYRQSAPRPSTSLA